MTFRVGVPASMQRLHVYRLGDDPKIALCETTCVVIPHHGNVDFDSIGFCVKCRREFLKEFGKAADTLHPEDLGVSELWYGGVRLP